VCSKARIARHSARAYEWMPVKIGSRTRLQSIRNRTRRQGEIVSWSKEFGSSVAQSRTDRPKFLEPLAVVCAFDRFRIMAGSGRAA